MVRAGEISYVSSINENGDMTVTHDDELEKSEHRSLEALSAVEFVGSETNKPAGDFNSFSSACDLKRNGWGVFRPEVYELKLMEYDLQGKP